MPVAIPSLEGSFYLKDPQSIIAFILRKYFRTPKDAVPLLGDMIISLRWQVANHGGDPETLTSNIRADLQSCYTRIFGSERNVTVTCTYTKTSSNTYSVQIGVVYNLLSGEVAQTGTTISLKDGQLVIPEDNLNSFFG